MTIENKDSKAIQIDTPLKSPVFPMNLSDPPEKKLKPIQDAISNAFQLFKESKIFSSDKYIQRKSNKIANEDSVFYITTLQSIDYSKKMIFHSENVIEYTQNRKIPTTDDKHYLQKMSIPKNLIKDSLDLKESIKGLKNDYEGILKSLGSIQDDLREYKCDVSERIRAIPYYESQIQVHKNKSQIHSYRSNNFFLFGGGIIFGALLIVICALGDIYSSIILPINLTMMIFGFLSVGIGLIFKMTSRLHLNEVVNIDEELQFTKNLSVTTNDNEIRELELHLIDLIWQLKMILAYWKKYQLNLENLIVELGHGNINIDQVDDFWFTIKQQ
ncbi:4831_t:CDS:1, partial [Diversispora eburnea]